ncbi:MAG: bacillithiol biosynthesis cysteine-adding enzyme BshC [Flavobacterium sp.]|nr:bacillithiol biosynthesis cysteine-adding enzyme BshC [Flavobacterium sp.]
MYIHYSDMPGFSNLFLDYISEFENVSKYYTRNVHSQAEYINLFKILEKKDRTVIKSVSDIAKSQYSPLLPSKKTVHNIEILKSANTIAVVTGQQLGIFGGPMYTFYKTITAIKLCQQLKEKYENFNFVPIFWLETEDHDFQEVSIAKILGKENQLVDLQYVDGLEEEVNRGPVSKNVFNDNLNNVIATLKENLRETEFKKPVLDYIEDFYKKDTTFQDSFSQLMFSIFDEYGLIILDPSDKQLKELLKPVFKKELNNFRDHTNILVERSAELDDIYHAQVKVKPINLFMIEENERLLIEPAENDYRLKGKRKKFTQEEIISLVDEKPEKFSPNVLLRPICQDYLLPTAFYVAGPGEISYFAQLMPLYDLFDIPAPVIYPRSSATIIEKGVKNIFEKFNLSYTDFLFEESAVFAKVMTTLSEVKIDNVFQDANKDIELVFDNIRTHLFNVDKTLVDLAVKTQERIFQTVEQLKNKATDAEKKKHETVFRQLSKVSNILYPNQNLQEREINFLYFVNKYGFDFLKDLFDELSVTKFEHQVIELE